MIIDFKPPKAATHPTFLLHKAKTTLLIFLSIVVFSYFFLDLAALKICYHIPAEITGLCQSLTAVFQPFFMITLFSSLFFFVHFIQQRKQASQKLWFISLGLTLPVFITYAVQQLIGRKPPQLCLLPEKALFQFALENTATASCLSCVSCAFFTCLACIYTKKSRPLLLTGILTGLLPAVTLQCFLSDSLLGLGMGMMLVPFVFRAMKKEISFFGP
jgi:hypothetical protein